jgi:hypothetical protein
MLSPRNYAPLGGSLSYGEEHGKLVSKCAPYCLFEVQIVIVSRGALDGFTYDLSLAIHMECQMFSCQTEQLVPFLLRVPMRSKDVIGSTFWLVQLSQYS